MNISYNWLKKYFDKDIPKPDSLISDLPLHAFEVENSEIKGDDFVMDIKTLPDRNHYALSHRGIAYEISAIFDIDMNWNEKKPTKNSKEIEISKDIIAPQIQIEDSGAYVYHGIRVNDIEVKESPKWLAQSLESIGQRSINNIVDIANYIMFDIGQPLHAFDADKVKGKIVVRKAKDGEKMITLDNRDLVLDSSMLIIADEDGPLAIAGIKGGKRAEVGKETKNLILESANFNPALIRQTATKIGLRTDAVKRFENKVAHSITKEAISSFASLISEIIPSSRFSNITSVYSEQFDKISAENSKTVSTNLKYLVSRLGADPGKEKIDSILKLLLIDVKYDGDNMILKAPQFRLDLNIADDYVDEIGRIWGYDNVGYTLTPKLSNDGKEILPILFWSEKIKNALIDSGFYETYLYSFVAKGDVEVMCPMAKDKGALRKNLSDGILGALRFNFNNAPLLNLDIIKIFEIGSIFPKEGERISCSLGIGMVKKQKGMTSESILKQSILLIKNVLGIEIPDNEIIIKNSEQFSIAEFDLSKIISTLKTPDSYKDLNFEKSSQNKYQKVSPYPFISRDIAFFVPGDVKESSAWDAIEVALKASGGKELLVKNYLFDVFNKKFEDGSTKTSYGFRLIFQSFDRTLNDEEINAIMDSIYKAIKDRGWEAR